MAVTRRPVACAGARLDGPRDDRPRPGHATSSSRSPRSSPTTSSRSWPRGPTSSSTSRPRRWPAWTTVVRDDAHPSGLLTAIEASTITLEEAGQRHARVHQGARARAAHGAAVRQLDRHRPALPRRLPARDRGVPALPLGRRVDDQGARPALVPGRARRRAPQGRPPTGPSTTSAESIDELRYYREQRVQARRTALDQPVK